MNAARVHIFMDGFGWSPQRDAKHAQLTIVREASMLPPLDTYCLITFFNASDVDDLDLLKDSIQELRRDAHWA